jgi:hypothetical protein
MNDFLPHSSLNGSKGVILKIKKILSFPPQNGPFDQEFLESVFPPFTAKK